MSHRVNLQRDSLCVSLNITSILSRYFEFCNHTCEFCRDDIQPFALFHYTCHSMVSSFHSIKQKYCFIMCEISFFI